LLAGTVHPPLAILRLEMEAMREYHLMRKGLLGEAGERSKVNGVR
jgi:hypothetical protein